MGRSVSVLSLDGELIECNFKKNVGKKGVTENEKRRLDKSIVIKMEEQSHLMRVVIRSAIICIESFYWLPSVAIVMTPVFSLSGNNSSLTPIPFFPKDSCFS